MLADAHVPTTRRSPITLASPHLDALIDPGRGGEIRSLRDRRSRCELLMRTPWAEEAICRPTGLAHPAEASAVSWMESYAGGWQVLFPHAGEPTAVGDEVRHYHGESSIVPWQVVLQTDASVHLETTLVTVPATMARSIVLDDDAVTIADRIENVSNLPVEYDYVQHPVFGSDLLSGGGTISTNALTYAPDPRLDSGELAAGGAQRWPDGKRSDGRAVDLSRIPGPAEQTLRFGWLDDFRGTPTVRIDSADRDVSVELTWSGPGLTRAWFWQEVAASTGYPWFGRGYAIGIEPATTATGGRSRARLTLQPRASVEYEVRVAVGRRDGSR